MSTRARMVVGAATTALMAALMAATPAVAADDDTEPLTGPPEITIDSAAAQIKTVTMTPTAQQAIELCGMAAACTVKMEAGTDAEQVATAAEVARDGDLQASDGTTLAQAASGGTIYVKHPWQRTYIAGLWNEKHQGTVCGVGVQSEGGG